jgi:hypothetical protein
VAAIRECVGELGGVVEQPTLGCALDHGDLHRARLDFQQPRSGRKAELDDVSNSRRRLGAGRFPG